LLSAVDSPLASRKERRIISLLPAATDLVLAWGMREELVGCSHECGVAGVAVCTEAIPSAKAADADFASAFQLHAETIRALNPTHILTQTLCAQCAVSFDDVCSAVAQLAPGAQLVSMDGRNLAGVRADFARIALALDAEDAGEALLNEMEWRMETIRERCHRSSRRKRVRCVDWLDPVLDAGLWVPELVAMANAELVSDDSADVLLVMPCSYTLDQTRTAWNEQVQAPSVFLIDGYRYFNRPGPALADSLLVLAEILHCERFPAQLVGEAWEPA
jgi:iron complex transport system substrate-binding protein